MLLQSYRGGVGPHRGGTGQANLPRRPLRWRQPKPRSQFGGKHLAGVLSWRPRATGTITRIRGALLGSSLFAAAALASVGIVATPAQPAHAQEKPSRPWSEDILYFVLIDRFADGSAANNMDVDRKNPIGFHGGDLTGLTQKLDDLKDLGVTALWINPVMLNIPGYVSYGDMQHFPHHGYWAEDFSKMDPRFGTEDELKTLVAEAHKRGIKVLLDIVYNHAGYGSAYTKQPNARQIIRSEDFGTCGPEGDDITGCVAGLPDFKTEKPEVAKWLIETQLPRAKAANVDGYRLDTVKHIAPEFWDTHRKMTRETLGEDFFLLAEVWGGSYESVDNYFAADQMDAAFDFTFQGETLGFLTGQGRAAAYSRYLEKRHKVRPGFIMSHYLSSHDVEGMLSQLGGDRQRFKLAAALQMAVLGLPQIYYGEEVGREFTDWPDNRTDMPWGDKGPLPGKGVNRDEEMRAFYKAIIAARKANPALSQGTYRELLDYKALDREWPLLVFQRTHEASGNAVIVAVNRAEKPQDVTVPLPASWAGKTVTDAISGKALGKAGGSLSLTVGGLTAQYLTAN